MTPPSFRPYYRRHIRFAETSVLGRRIWPARGLSSCRWVKVEGASLFRRSTVRIHVVLPSFVMVDKQVEAHDLIEAGKFSKAAKVLRKKAGLSRREARDAVATLRSGDVLPEWPMPDKPALSARVADLKAAGRRKEALFLVRIEQHVSEAEAERFVESA